MWESPEHLKPRQNTRTVDLGELRKCCDFVAAAGLYGITRVPSGLLQNHMHAVPPSHWVPPFRLLACSFLALLA